MYFPKVVMIILNWNGWQDTIECLESVYQADYPNFHVILVDNNSQDNSVEKIRDYCSGELEIKSHFFDYNSQNKPIEILQPLKGDNNSVSLSNKIKYSNLKSLFLIKNDVNYGYAEGNNIGVKFALKNLNPDYILLLNNDIVVDSNFLKEMVKFAEINHFVGVVGPKVYYYDFPEKIQVTSTKMNFWRGTPYLVGDGEIDNGQFNEIKETDFVSGSCFLVKTEVIENIGLFNPEYKCYWEETDFCMSAKEKGYKCFYYPDSKVWHKASKSTNKIPGLLTYYMTRNMFFFMKKHAKRYHYTIFILFFFGLKFWYTNLTFVRNKEYENISYFIKGIKDGF